MTTTELFCTYCQAWVTVPHNCAQATKGTAHINNKSSYRVASTSDMSKTQLSNDSGRISGKRTTYYRQ